MNMFRLIRQPANMHTCVRLAAVHDLEHCKSVTRLVNTQEACRGVGARFSSEVNPRYRPRNRTIHGCHGTSTYVPDARFYSFWPHSDIQRS
jgi:hypothetical protein